MESSPAIGTLNEGSLHRALKEHYACPGDEFEVPIGDFVVDIRRGLSGAGGPLAIARGDGVDGGRSARRGRPRVVEIQTGSFKAMGRKLDHLLDEHDVLVVYPVAARTVLRRRDGSSRRSPKRGSVYSLFDELVSLPTMIDHPALSIDVVLAEIGRVQVTDASARRGRGGYRTVDRRLEGIVAVESFASVDDLCRLIPDGLPDEFTTADLAQVAGVDRATAQKMAYCFRPLGVFEEVGRTGRGIIHRRAA